MIQCKDCEYFRRDPSGRISFACDPFGTVKEPECLAKWELLKLDQMVQAYHAQVAFNRKLAPLQEKMFKMVQRELEDMNEADSWKAPEEEDEDPSPDEPPQEWSGQ